MSGMAALHCSVTKRDGGLAQRCHRGALPCSGTTTTPLPCPSMVWGIVLSPHLTLLPGLLHCAAPRGLPFTLESK